MLPIKMLILIASVMGTSHSISDLKIRYFSKDWNFPKQQKFELFNPTELFGKDNKFVHSQCIVDDTLDFKYLNCTMTQEYFNVDGLAHKDTCHIYDSARDGHKVLGVIQRSFLENLIVYFYLESPKHEILGTLTFDGIMYIRLLNMSNCKHISENSIYINSSYHEVDYNEDYLRSIITLQPDVIQYTDGSYDLFILADNLCDGARCRYSVDKNGKSVGKILSYLPEEYDMNYIKFYPVDVKDSYLTVVTGYDFTKDFLRIDKNHEYTILYAKPGGKTDVLLDLPRKVRYFDANGFNNRLTFCWTDNHTGSENSTKIKCAQFGSNGTTNYTDFGCFPYKINSLKIKQLSEDSLLLMTERCHVDGCHNGSNKYYLRNMNLKEPKAPHSPTLEIESFQLPEQILIDSSKDSDKATHITVDDENNVCLSIAISADRSSKWSLRRGCIEGRQLNIGTAKVS